jgi:ribosome maturation factor RimP
MEFLAVIKNYLVELLKNYDVELYDVTYRREPLGNILRVVVDGNSVSFKNLEVISKELVRWLDDNAIIKSNSYRIEVSSPGINRKLRNVEDFKKNVGSKCIIFLKKDNDLNRKCIKGRILAVTNSMIDIEENNKTISISYDKIKNSKLNEDIVF